MDNSQTVLFVDDEEGMRTVMEIFIRKEGHGFISAANPSSALAMLDSGKIGIVVSDLTFPDAGSKEVLEFFE